jgi:molybdate transport system substrate-binding protein
MRWGLAAALVAALAAGALVTAGGPAGSSDPPTVYAASSLRDVLTRIDRGARYDFAGSGALRLRIERGATRVRAVADLRRPGLRLAVGGDGVPVGAYTRTALGRLGLGALLDGPGVSRERDVASITAKVALGSADAGFVYATDVRTAEDRLRRIDLPAAARPEVRYAACVVRGADASAAEAFLARLTGAAGRAALRDAGFGLP